MAFLADKLAGAVGGVKDKIEAELNEMKGRVEQLKDEKLQMLKDFEAEKKAMLAQTLLSKMNGVFDHIFTVLLVKTKEVATDDNYMPKFVKRMCEDLVDALWPDIKSEAKSAVLQGILDDNPLAHGDESCCCSPLAFFRYHVFPYDRNIWRLIRDPFWWLMSLLSIIPVYSVSAIYYMCMLFMIDKNDEFQLQQYVTIFKSLQFISLGVLSAVVGSIQYYLCTTNNPNTCATDAPREELFTVFVFCAQLLFIWCAFFLARSADKKGGQYYQLTAAAKEAAKNEVQEKDDSLAAVCMGTALNEAAYETNKEQEDSCRRRLMYLLIYDFCVFLICLILALWAMYANSLDGEANVHEHEDSTGNGNWKFTATLFWIKALYGFLSFPFVLLRIPGISTIFSHAKPTGYNRWGNCIPYKGKEEKCATPWKEADPPEEEEGANEPTTV
jgi:cytochrome bd-type quinol oxidase subunit 2